MKMEKIACDFCGLCIEVDIDEDDVHCPNCGESPFWTPHIEEKEED
jgi:predicted RNA-binding Zn-ribbon protein involved in translation (DUF1610 family)